MSINVEMIGTGLVVQHYAYETAGKDHCDMVSISDVLTPSGWTAIQVIWDLKADPIDDKTSKYTNTVTSHPTAEFMDFIARHGQTVEEAATARRAASGDHCRPGRLHLRLPEVRHLNLGRTRPGEGRVIRGDRLRPARR